MCLLIYRHLEEVIHLLDVDSWNEEKLVHKGVVCQNGYVCGCTDRYVI